MYFPLLWTYKTNVSIPQTMLEILPFLSKNLSVVVVIQIQTKSYGQMIQQLHGTDHWGSQTQSKNASEIRYN